MRWKPITVVLAAIFLAALLISIGCAGKNTSRARYLNSGEANQLLARQQAASRTLAQAGDSQVLKPSSLSLEKHADLLSSRGDLAAALIQYQRALIMAKKEARWRIIGKAARLNLRLGQFGQARNLYQRLLKQFPNSAWVKEGMGLALFGLGEMRASKSMLVQATRLDGRLWRAQNALGVVLSRARRPRQAIKALKAARKIKPNHPAIHNNLGLAYLLLGYYNSAEASFQEALEIDPNYHLARNNLGLLLAKRHRTREAFQTFSRSIGRAKAHNNVGCMLYWLGNERDARHHFRKAMETAPSYYNLAARHLEAISLQDKK